jgi:cAMP-dependent protein kinase regulator
MEEVKFAKGDFVIKQGDDGDVLYFVFTGNLDCHKVFPNKTEPTHLLTYTPGMSFGELALLYNTPRAASIVANEDSVVYSLDRECFNNIVKDAAIKRRNKFDSFLSKVELLQELDQYERSKICDCLQPQKYAAGDYIITEGDTGNTFYFIETGQCYATKKNSSGGTDRVYEYSANDYFGELSLLKDIPRQASVIAQVSLFPKLF